MPNIKSAVKRESLSARQREANKSKRSALRTIVKKAAASLQESPDQARDRIILAAKKLDQAASAGLIHKNKAARKKSRLMKQLNAIMKQA